MAAIAIKGKMKKTIILLVAVLLYTFFLPHRAVADYSQDLNTCNKILSKSTSPNEYCTIHIDAITGNRITGPMVVIYNAYVYPESGIKRATKLLEEEYKSKLNWMKNPSDQRSGLEKYMNIIEETGPSNMKFLIRQSSDLAFYTGGGKKVLSFSSYLFMQQGSCVMVVDGDANMGYRKRQDGRNEDVDGDVEKLKQESITYMNKVSNDLVKNCKKEIIRTETPVVPALIDEIPKESDFRKVDRSDFKLIYLVSTNSANLKSSTQSANLKGKIFIGKVSGEGEIVIERTDGDAVNLKDDYTGGDVGEARVIWKHNVKLSNHRFKLHIAETDCHIQIAQNITRAESDAEQLVNIGVIRRAGTIFDPEKRNIMVGDCSDLNIERLTRIFVQKGPAILNLQNSSVVADQGADLGMVDDVSSGMSIVEIYNGSVAVKNKSGQVKTISSVYGSEIRRIEVSKDGVMNERIAIPQSEWDAFLVSQQEKKQEIKTDSSLFMFPITVVLGMGGLALFLYKTGRLLPLLRTLFQKISDQIGKFKKINKEKGK